MKITDSKIIKAIKKGVKINLEDKDAEFAELKNMGYISENKCEKKHISDIINSTEILTITLFLTNQCNFRCIYCYEKHDNSKLNYKTYDTLMKFIKHELNIKEIKKVRINLFGGEPLLEYESVIEFLKKINMLKAEFNKLEVSIGITTNGYLLTKEKCIQLSEYNLTDIQITIDGFRDNHNKKRPTINAEATWDVIMSNIDDIIESNVPVKIILRTNFDRYTLSKEKNFILYCKRRFFGKIVMHFEAIKDWGAECSIDYINHADEEYEVLDLIRFCRLNKIATIYDDVLAIGFYACQHNMKNSYIFNTELKVLKCTVELSLSENYVGVLNEKGLIEYNENINLWKNIEDNCKSCKLLPQCMQCKCPARYIKNKKFRCRPDIEVVKFEKYLKACYL